MKRLKGFTLIELMVVIVIIGIIASIMIPHLVRGKFSAQLTSCQFNLRSLGTALETYAADYGTYPADSDWRENIFTPQDNTIPYLDQEPQCPSNNTDYSYLVNLTSDKTYTLSCNGIHYLVLKELVQGYPQYNPTRGMWYKP